MGGAQADPRSVLAAMVAQREFPAEPQQDSPPLAAEADPEAQPAPVPEEIPGENLPPETETTLEESSGAEEATEAQSPAESPDSGLAEAFKGLSATERKAALELVKTLQPGEIPRIARLVAAKYQAEETIEKLTAKLEAAEAERDSGAVTGAPATAAMPATVAKLRNVTEVASRLEEVQGQAEAIQDFLDANPGDGAAEYQIGDKLVTRAQLIQQRAALRTELKALPARREQLEYSAKVTAQQAEVRNFLTEKIPQFYAEANPVGQAARKLIQSDPYVASLPNRDYVALCMAYGEAELRKLLLPAPAKKPAGAVVANGKVPLGKPHTNGNTSAKPANGNLQTALARHATERSAASFAEILSATGR
jgi:hypothetical protein